MKAWLVHHGRSASLAWRRLTATPVNSLLSLLAIGIALALPAGGQMLLSGIRDLAGNSTATPRISVFMNIAAERAVADNIRSGWNGTRECVRRGFCRAKRHWRA